MRPRFFVALILLIVLSLELDLRFRRGYGPGSDRYLHPYIVMGGFHHGGFFRGPRDPAEIPEAVGYEQKGLFGAYIFNPKTEVKSISDRGAFLYRDRAGLADRKDGSLKLFILGGSSAVGEGASRPESRWFVKLEEILSKRLGRRIHAIPAANHSHVSTQERIILDLYVLPRKPDLVVSLSGFNDANTHNSATRPGDPYGQSVWYREHESPFYAWLTDLSNYSMILRHLLLNDILASMQDSWKSKEIGNHARSVASVFSDNVSWMGRRCRLEKVPCFFFLQPTRDLTRTNRGESPQKVDTQLMSSYGEIRTRAGRDLRDLTSVFDDNSVKSPFLDPAHFNDEGHERIPRAVADAILSSNSFPDGLQ